MGSFMKSNRQHNHGAALITVLIMTTIVMALITNITVQNLRVITRLNNKKVLQQSYTAMRSAIDFGRAGLATSGTTSQIDTLNDIWAQPIPSTKFIGDLLISGYVIDEQSKFNINDLVSNGQINPIVLAQFNQLLNSLNIPVALGNNIAFYMASPQFEGDISQYTSANPAYRPAGKPLVDLSELLLVNGMSPDWIYKLQDYVTAIPVPIYNLALQESAAAQNQSSNPTATPPAIQGTIAVNVNTASAQVISAKSGIPLPIAQRMTAIRDTTPFQSQQDITTFLGSNGIILSQGDGNQISVSMLSTASDYFTIHAQINQGDYEFAMVAMVYRGNRNGTWPTILWQHQE